MNILLIGILSLFVVDIEPNKSFIAGTCTQTIWSWECNNITTSFPMGNWDLLVNLKCNNCSIKVFSAETFPFQNNVLGFHVNGSHIQNVTTKAFSSFKSAKYIHLEHNDIVNISKDAFFGLKGLMQLHLEHNKLVELTPGFLNDLQSEVINMKYNKLRRIPQDVFLGIYMVESIDLSFNEIESLYTDTFRGLPGLRSLNLQYNKLECLPYGVFKHTIGLMDLNLAGNKLKHLPYGIFSPVKYLATLNISHNVVRFEFESNMLIPTKVKELDLSGLGLSGNGFDDIHRDAPFLRKLILYDNFYSCTQLTRTIKNLRAHNIDVCRYTSGRYDIMNMCGIACTFLHFDTSNFKIFEDFLKLVEFRMSSC